MTDRGIAVMADGEAVVQFEGPPIDCPDELALILYSFAKRVADRAVAEEREACAKMADEVNQWIGKSIRERGNHDAGTDRVQQGQ